MLQGTYCQRAATRQATMLKLSKGQETMLQSYLASQETMLKLPTVKGPEKCVRYLLPKEPANNAVQRALASQEPMCQEASYKALLSHNQ